MPIAASASRRFVSPPSKTSTHASSLLAALDALDLDATEANESNVNSAKASVTGVEREEKAHGSVERLVKPGKAQVPYVYLLDENLTSIEGEIVFILSFKSRVVLDNRLSQQCQPRARKQQPRRVRAQVKPLLGRNQSSRSAANKGTLLREPSPSIHTRTAHRRNLTSSTQDTRKKLMTSSRALNRGSFLDCRFFVFVTDLTASFSTVAMDLEWRVTYFRKPGSNSSVQNERRAAVVQIADGSGLILVVQVNEMRSELFSSALQRRGWAVDGVYRVSRSSSGWID